MYICPKCGSISPRETRQCPLEDGRPVCARCCHECPYYDTDPQSMWTCRYYIAHPQHYHAPLKEDPAHEMVEACIEIINRR